MKKIGEDKWKGIEGLLKGPKSEITVNPKGDTFIHIASRQCHHNVVEFLIQLGMEPNDQFSSDFNLANDYKHY